MGGNVSGGDEEIGTYVVAHEQAVEKLQSADCDQESHECVDELDALGGGLEVFVPYAGEDFGEVGGLVGGLFEVLDGLGGCDGCGGGGEGGGGACWWFGGSRGFGWGCVRRV